MARPTTPNSFFNNTSYLVNIARKFSSLAIICYHGHYPNMHQLVGAAFKYKNIYPMPDIYGFIAGNEVFIKAENTFLQDQLLFDFLYPFIPIKRSIDDFAVFRFDDYVFEKLFYKNAVRIFSLVL